MTDQAGQKRVVVTLPVLMVGGTEMQTLALIRVLVGAGYEVTLCCFYQSDSHMVERFDAEGARVVLLAQQWENGLWSLLISLILFFRAERPAIVHVQYMAPGLIPVVAARLAGVKLLIATVHQPGRTYSRKARIYLRVAARLCRVFVCNSLAVERSWFGSSWLLTPTEERAPRGHLTIYNAVDCCRIDALAGGADPVALRHEFGVPDVPIIGVVGRLRHEKGQALLLDAMAGVVKIFPMARLLVVGDGPDADALKRHAEQTGLQNHVIWCGMTDADRVFQLYRLMDVVAVPSHFEGFGLVAAEAMAAGRAVVASAVDGLAEVVEDGVTGLLVPPGDSVALAAALIDLLQHPAKATEMGRQGKARVRKLFSMERYRESILAAYAQCAKPGQAGGQG